MFSLPQLFGRFYVEFTVMMVVMSFHPAQQVSLGSLPFHSWIVIHDKKIEPGFFSGFRFCMILTFNCIQFKVE
jgi:hypothetical protein